MPPKTSWSTETYKDIAVAVWEVARLSPEQVDRIIQKLHNKGYRTLTKEAVRQRFQKIIRAENAASGSNDAEAGSPTAGGSSTARPRANRKAAGKRKAISFDSDDDEEPEVKKKDEEDEKPDVKKKRVKRETRATKKEKKEEEDDDKDDGHWSGREEARKGFLAKASYKDDREPTMPAFYDGEA